LNDDHTTSTKVSQNNQESKIIYLYLHVEHFELRKVGESNLREEEKKRIEEKRRKRKKGEGGLVSSWLERRMKIQHLRELSAIELYRNFR
jgi:hypothetical protein